MTRLGNAGYSDTLISVPPAGSANVIPFLGQMPVELTAFLNFSGKGLQELWHPRQREVTQHQPLHTCRPCQVCSFAGFGMVAYRISQES